MSCRKAFNILAPNCVTRDRQLFILITLPSLSSAGPTGRRLAFFSENPGRPFRPLQAVPCGQAVSGASRRGPMLGIVWVRGDPHSLSASPSLPAAFPFVKHCDSRQLI